MQHPEWKDADSVWPGLITALLLILLSGAYVAGLFPDVMETDAAQYASISAEMARTGEYLQVKHRHENYLDKPPLLFWLSSISVKILGNKAWAYKLPSFLFTLLGLWSIFRLALIYYPRKVAWNALFILGSCQAWFLFNNDVRTDTLLAAWVVFSVWQFSAFITYRSVWGIILGSFGLGLAMLAKGPIALIVVGTAIGSQILFSRNWKALFSPFWFLALVITAGLLAPMTYGLYEQFGVKGPEFFFWTQSFGRITGENEWRNDATFLYFFHTFPWAFLPWFPLALLALADTVRLFWKNKFHTARSLPETMSLFAFVLPFLALSFSHFKLPHYIFVTFPFAALLTARFLHAAASKASMRGWVVGFTLPGVVALLLISVSASVLAFQNWKVWFLLCLTVMAAVLLMLYSDRKKILACEWPVVFGVAAAAWANLQLNLIFYPELLRYQPGKSASEFVRDAPAGSFFALYGVSDHPLEFHGNRILPYYFSSDVSVFTAEGGSRFLYTDREGLDDLRRIGYRVTVVREYPRHHPALLTLSFLNPETRQASLDYRYWVTAEPAH